MINLEQREDFLNRHLINLPDFKCTIKTIHNDVDGEHVYVCKWKPFDKTQYNEANMPGDGYLGTATIIEGKYSGIGFHAWKQNNSEFIYYSYAN